MAAVSEKEKIVSWLNRGLLWSLLTGLPLVYHNGYFDITETKTAFFVLCSALYLMGRLVCTIQFGADKPRRLAVSEICALLFCFVSLLASLSSGFFRDSFFGPQGRWQGTGMLWLYAALWAALRDQPLKKEDVLMPLAAGLALSALFAVANHLGWDGLRLSASLGAFDAGRYISTLGNINFAGAYFALTVPVAARAWLTAESPRKQLVWVGVTVLGVWASMAVRSECSVLGLGVGFALLPLTVKDKKELQRWCLLLVLLAVWMQIYSLATSFCDAGLSALTRLLVRPTSAIALALPGAILYWLLRPVEDPRQFQRVYGVGLAGLLILFAAALLWLNTTGKHVPLGELESWLRFSDEWGTDRWKVWRHCLTLRGGFGVWEKLIGGGCGILARLDAHDRIFADAVLDAAHCEYLQILINWGTLGLLSYLGWISFSLRESLRRSSEFARLFLPGLAAYAAQAAVNIAQAPGISLFFLLLAVSRAHSEAQKPE